MPLRPVIALLTDFGLSDHYVGTMKGVVLEVCREATLVDISHDIPPQDVVAAAFELAAAYRYFPGGTIFLVVVDPGVGSSRKAIAAEAGDYRFVGPDNGIFSIVFERMPPRSVVELTEPRYARSTISRTFEGRDRFAPAAAWLASGVEVAALGRPVESLQPLDVPKPRRTSNSIDGCVVRVDRFGNLITNIDRKSIDGFGTAETLTVRAADRQLDGVVQAYADAAPGELCALFGSSDHLEIAARGGNAAAMLGLRRGAAVHVGRRA